MRKWAPWSEDFQVEQDLVISRALVAVYTEFDGDTAVTQPICVASGNSVTDCFYWWAV